MKKADCSDDITKLGIQFPCVVKPCCGGSSIGVSIAHNAEEYKAALDEAFRWEENLIVEEYVKGREFSVGVIEGKHFRSSRSHRYRDFMIIRINTKQAVLLRPVRQNFQKLLQRKCSIMQSRWHRYLD